MKTYLVWLSFFAFTFGASALPGMRMPCPGQVHHSAVNEWQDMVHTVSIVGKVDNRKTFSDYKTEHWPPLSDEDMKLQFSGNGEFHCGGGAGGASFVFRNDLLVPDAHTFFHWSKDKSKCLGPISKAELQQCYIKIISAQGVVQDQRYPINPATLQMNRDYCDNEHLTGNDWAVVELKHDPQIGLPAVVPYSLYDTDQLKSSDGSYKTTNVTVVSAGATNFKGGPVPTICDGEMDVMGLEKDSIGNAHIWQTNSCSSGPGDSGAGIAFYAPGKAPRLLGVQTFGKPSSFDGQPYGDDNFSGGTFITGDFREAILACKTKCPLSGSASN